MNRDTRRFYIRVKAVCCRAWGISPAEFDSLARSDRLTAEDVIETLILESTVPFLGDNIRPFLEREKALKKRSTANEIIALAMKAKGTKDPEEREKIIERIRELQNGGRRKGRTQSKPEPVSKGDGGRGETR